jgi:hypothetical protein
MTTHKTMPRVLLTLTLALAAAGCSQPPPYCLLGRGDFAAKYTLVSGTGACSTLTGEVVGAQSYNYPQAGSPLPDLKHGSIALLPATIGDLTDRAASQDLGDEDLTHKPYARGDFDAARPGDDDFCAVSKLSVAEENLPAVPAVPPDPEIPDDPGLPEQPATQLRYEWSGVRVLCSPAYQGTQFVADLTYDRDGCSATYRVSAVYPAVPCADADGNPDDRLCSAEAIPEAGMEYGSGISPDFPVVCDADLLLCVLEKEPPALK